VSVPRHVGPRVGALVAEPPGREPHAQPVDDRVDDQRATGAPPVECSRGEPVPVAQTTEDQATDQLASVWTRTLAGLADGTLSPQHLAFLRLTRPMALVGDTVLIAAPNDFARDVIENRLRAVLTEALA